MIKVHLHQLQASGHTETDSTPSKLTPRRRWQLLHRLTLKRWITGNCCDGNEVINSTLYSRQWSFYCLSRRWTGCARVFFIPSPILFTYDSFSLYTRLISSKFICDAQLMPLFPSSPSPRWDQWRIKLQFVNRLWSRSYNKQKSANETISWHEVYTNKQKRISPHMIPAARTKQAAQTRSYIT